MTESSNEVLVHGLDVDAETRCSHWHSPLDVVAIKFKCCGDWYACIECHGSLADHQPAVWLRQEFDHHAILCGACRSELTVREYLGSNSRCPLCDAEFNPGCAKHYGLYFDV